MSCNPTKESIQNNHRFTFNPCQDGCLGFMKSKDECAGCKARGDRAIRLMKTALEYDMNKGFANSSDSSSVEHSSRRNKGKRKVIHNVAIFGNRATAAKIEDERKAGLKIQREVDAKLEEEIAIKKDQMTKEHSDVKQGNNKLQVNVRKTVTPKKSKAQHAAIKRKQGLRGKPKKASSRSGNRVSTANSRIISKSKCSRNKIPKAVKRKRTSSSTKNKQTVPCKTHKKLGCKACAARRRLASLVARFQRESIRCELS